MDDELWFRSHLSELRRKHEGRLVAVLGGEVVAVGDDLQEMAREIKRRRERGEVRGVPFIGRASDDPAAVYIPTPFA